MRHNVTLSLAAAKHDTRERLTRACAAAIQSGFRSNALGRLHTYPSRETDQINLAASVLDAVKSAPDPAWTTPFTAAPAGHEDAPEWPLIAHTQAQIKQVGDDGKAWVLAQRQHLRALLRQVDAATTVPEALAVRWGEGG